MANGTLYTYPNNFRAFKILIAAEYSGAKVNVPSDFTLGETNKTEAFLKKFSLGKVPAFESSEGLCLFESNAIAYYVANDQLRGSNACHAALIQQFVNFADNEILPSAATWVFPTYGVMQYNKQNTEKAIEVIKKCLAYLDAHLLTKTYLVGERISLADITVACNLLMLYKQVLEPTLRAPYGNVNRWFTTLVNQPEFKKVVGEVTFCTKMATFDAAKFAQLNPKKPKESKKQQPAKQPKAATPKKEEKKDKEEEEPPKPKKKDLFVDLPKTTFNFDQFKRVYSNEDTITKAIPFFWEHFDKENMSIWYCDYKYNDELTRIFMTANLIGGMFQRLGELAKVAFGSMLIFGEDNKNSISGVWVFRGHQLGFELSEDFQVDSPYYNFKKLDPDNEDDKKLFNAHLAWEGDFGGKVVNQGKVFK